MSAPVVAAIVARIASGPLSAHDAAPASPTYPYVVVYADGGVSTPERECDERVFRAISWQTTIVGISAAQCRAALDRMVPLLDGWTPTVTGRSCSRPTTAASPIRS